MQHICGISDNIKTAIVTLFLFLDLKVRFLSRLGPYMAFTHFYVVRFSLPPMLSHITTLPSAWQ